MVTAGSKEARQIEKVKHIFEKMYRESDAAQKNTVGDGEVKYSISGEDLQKGAEVADFFEDVLRMLDVSRRSKRRWRVGEITPKHARVVETLMKTLDPDFSLDGYELWIDGTAVDHIEDRHGANGEHDHSMSSREDRMMIPHVTNSPDGGEFLRHSDGSLDLSDRFYNFDKSPAPQIRLMKMVPGHIMYVSECVPDSRNKRIYITSAYKTKVKSSTNQLLSMDSNKSPQPTPEAIFDGSATSNPIISQPPPNVNSKNSLSPLGDDFPIRSDLRGTPASELRYEPASANEGIQYSEMDSKKNRLLDDSDSNSYMGTGKTLHTRNKKTRMLESGKNPILTTIGEIKQFIFDAIRSKAVGEVRAYGVVGSDLANAISDVNSSVEAEGKYIELNADDLRESYKRHSEPKEKGDIPLSEEDFARIPEYLDEFDGVLSVDKYHEKVEIHLYKELDDGYVRILTVSSKERNSLIVSKLIGVSKEKFEAKYGKKIERNAGSPRGQNASTPSTKARLTAGVLSDTIISHTEQFVKSEDVISSEIGTGVAKTPITAYTEEDMKITTVKERLEVNAQKTHKHLKNKKPLPK